MPQARGHSGFESVIDKGVNRYVNLVVGRWGKPVQNIEVRVITNREGAKASRYVFLSQNLQPIVSVRILYNVVYIRVI